jgi:hypothetical protein
MPSLPQTTISNRTSARQALTMPWMASCRSAIAGQCCDGVRKTRWRAPALDRARCDKLAGSTIILTHGEGVGKEAGRVILEDENGLPGLLQSKIEAPPLRRRPGRDHAQRVGLIPPKQMGVVDGGQPDPRQQQAEAVDAEIVGKAREDIGVHRVGEEPGRIIDDNQSDRSPLGEPQAARAFVGSIVQFAHHGFDAVPRGRRHQLEPTVRHIGRGRHGNMGRRGNIRQRHARLPSGHACAFLRVATQGFDVCPERRRAVAASSIARSSESATP